MAACPFTPVLLTPDSLGPSVAGTGVLPSVCESQSLSAESQLATVESEPVQPAANYNTAQ